MVQESPSIVDEAERFNLIDFVAAIAEAWKYVLIVPLAIGTVALVISLYTPKAYVSRAIIEVPSGFLIPVKDNAVVDRVIHALDLVTKTGSVEVARARVSNSYYFMEDSQRVEKGSTRYVGRFTDDTAAGAKRLGEEVLTALFSIDRPKGQRRESLERSLAVWTETRDRYLALLRTFTKIAGSGADADRRPDDLLRMGLTFNYPLVIDGLRNAELTIVDLNNKLRGLEEEVVVQAPTLPDGPRLSSWLSAVALSVLLSGFVVISAVMTVEAIRQLRRHPDPHYTRLFRALGLTSAG